MNYEDLSRDKLIDLLHERDYQIAEMGQTNLSNIWGFSARPSTWTILNMLSRVAPRTVTHSAIIAATCQDHANPPHVESVKAQMHYARQSIALLGIEICTNWGRGYFMSEGDAVKFKRWKVNFEAGNPPCPDFPLRKSPSETFTTVGEAATRVLKRVAHD